MVDRYSNSRRESKISHTHYSNSSASHFGGGGGSSNTCPSFSSMLLDEIYRSIDQAAEEEMAGAYGGEHTARKIRDGHHHANIRPALFTSSGEIIMADYYQHASCIVEKKKSRKVRHGSSSTSSWDSSCGGGGGFFSSSEAESFRSKKFGEIIINHTDSEISPRGDSRRGFGDRLEQKSKTKLRALKIYGDLKKMKQQPISPGRKLAGFLNSFFTAGNLKKKVNGTAIRGGGDSPAPKSTNPSTGLSSKTPPSRGKYSADARRTVSFFPMSLIADEEDSRGAPENYDEVNIMKTAIDEVHVMKKNRRVGEAARDFLMNIYQKKKEIMGCDQFVDHQSHSSDHLRKTNVDQRDFEEEEEFDAESYESSDLFELNNLSAIGIMQEMRYREELPVYETTHLDTNRVITN